MAEPTRLLLKLSQRLFPTEEDAAAFVSCLTQPQPLHPCILWRDPRSETSPFECIDPLSWQPAFVDRLVLGQRPGQHPLHDQGAFYCLDFSSVFAASVLLNVPQPIETAIDVCASPGGKSIFAWLALQPSRLVSNEVIGKRMAQLISNLKRCRIAPAIARNLDPKILADEIPQTAQVVIVDTPCSGQSLLAKGGKAPGCFHPVTINGNAKRQKRILANAAQLVAGQGYLAYMTCTYSPAENEEVVEWLCDRFPQFQAVDVPHLSEFQSQYAVFPCYRLFPQSGLGAGAFTALLRNTKFTPPNPLPEEFLQRARYL